MNYSSIHLCNSTRIEPPPHNLRSSSPLTGNYTDGSIESDLPMQQLSELFNVNHFIVSQVLQCSTVPVLCSDAFEVQYSTVQYGTEQSRAVH